MAKKEWNFGMLQTKVLLSSSHKNHSIEIIICPSSIRRSSPTRPVPER
jgi:hypothetical protein